jgi:multidrug resistance efflux pump
MRVAVLLMIGLVIGLGISWGLFPVRMNDRTPGTLTQTDKDQYQVLIAENYLSSHDLERAKASLELIDGEQNSSRIKDQLERTRQETDSEQIYAALSGLERALAGVSVKAMPTQIDTLMP